jgi:hypothetical protein
VQHIDERKIVLEIGRQEVDNGSVQIELLVVGVVELGDLGVSGVDFDEIVRARGDVGFARLAFEGDGG